MIAQMKQHSCFHSDLYVTFEHFSELLLNIYVVDSEVLLKDLK